MYLLITYDVETITSSGRRRLRQVAKCCLNYGQRVQNSVFECSINGADFVSFKSQLNTLIDHAIFKQLSHQLIYTQLQFPILFLIA